jgi:tRNA(Ile)-lysidine synthase
MPSSSGSPPDPADVLDRVRAFVEERRLWPARRPMLAAVSGGPDSVCLLDVLSRLRKGRGRLVIAHVDHGLRPDSSRDASLVQQLAAEASLPCEVVRVDVGGFARKHRIGLEQAARALRYRALADVAGRQGSPLVATGHTADDAVESVLMHLVRGAGPEGLRGIAARQMIAPAALGPVDSDVSFPQLDVVRPLLPLRRAETVRYCETRGLDWTEDPMNEDPRYLRNRVRHHLLPTLRTYNPRIDRALLRTSELLRDEDMALERVVDRVWSRVVRECGGGCALHVPILRRQPVAVRRRLVRRALADLDRDGSGFGYEAVTRILGLLAGDRPGRVQVGQRVIAVREGDLIQFRRESKS